MFFWDSKYDKYITLQRNHKRFSAEMLTSTIKVQQKEIDLINSFLSQPPKTVMDIGCGLGIYDLALHDYYKSDIDYYLVDKSTDPEEESKVFYGFKEQGAFYNDLDYTHQFLEQNGIPSDNLHMIHVEETQEETCQYLEEYLPNIDLVISIISCGFHYPVSSYLDTVKELLSDDGLFCFHCRGLEENLPVIESSFDILHPQKEEIKSGSFLICKKRASNVV